MTNADVLLAKEQEGDEVAAAIELSRRLSRHGPPSPDVLDCFGDGGWCGETALGIALLCALTADLRTPDDVSAALWIAVNHSGDSDSTGALTGNLLGAMGGIHCLPEQWLIQIELYDLISQMCQQLASGIHGDEL